MPHNPDSPDCVQLEIPVDKLAALFNAGVICVADLHCLNTQSKNIVRDLCKKACARQLQCQSVDIEIEKLSAGMAGANIVRLPHKMAS